MGMFFNLDSVATSIFNNINASYYRNKASVKPASKRPVMAFVDLYTYPPDTAYEVSLAAYKVQYAQVCFKLLKPMACLVAVDIQFIQTEGEPIYSMSFEVCKGWTATVGT